jgi:hypothetical protein
MFWNFSFDGIVSLPSLQHLSIDGSWTHLPALDAPNLVSLVLLGSYERQDVQELDCDQVTLLPKTLHLDKTLPPPMAIRLLTNIGKKLEEITLSHLKRDETIPEGLALALIGQKGKVSLCPLLRRIDILCPEPERLASKETSREIVREMVDKRDFEGPLHRVRYGFYKVPKRVMESLEFASRKWWNVEWTELLWL